MRTDDFDYRLPHELIAQHPAPRGSSRLFAIDREGAERHGRFRDLPSLLAPGDLVVVNDSRVLPARLFATTEAGGRVEVLLLEPEGELDWIVLARPARKLRPGRRLALPLGIELECRERLTDGKLRVRLSRPIEDELDEIGHVPLPPYIRRADNAADRERYQTIFARSSGSVAAPTAGLHFSDEVVEELASRGIGLARVTLHVGLGTFRPVSVGDLRQHRMDAERYEIPAETAAAIRATRRAGGRVLAVGTTVVRTLEAAALAAADDTPSGAGRTDLFIVPGFRFRAVDLLLTNFHLPRSTLLMLVAAFVGRDRCLDAYREAIAESYRFYSYGDAMLAERRSAP